MLRFTHTNELNLIVSIRYQIFIQIIELPEPGSTGALVIMTKIMEGYFPFKERSAYILLVIF